MKLRHQILTAAAALAMTASAGAADTIERTFDVGAGGQLEVRSDVGSIEIETGGNNVQVTVVREGRDAEDFKVEMSQDGELVRIVGDMDGRKRWGNRLNVEFRIRVPSRFDLDLETSGGHIEVADLDGQITAQTAGGHLDFGRVSGEVEGRTAGGSVKLRSGGQNVELKTAGGSIRVGDVAGDARVRTAGGSIRVGNVNGELRANTAGGSIEIGRVQGPVDARTAGGSIDVEEAYEHVRADTSGGSVNVYFAGQPSGNSRIDSQGGTATVAMASGLAFDIDARSGRGSIRSDFDFPASAWDDPEERSSLRAPLNGGGPRLSVYGSQRVVLRDR